MSHRRLRCAAVFASLALMSSAAAAGQGASAAPDAVDLALAYPRGAFGTPVVCRFGDQVKRGLRRIIIAPGPRTSELRVDRINFLDLGADGASHCTDDLGAEEPNIVGTLFISYTAKRPRSDTPQRDIDQELKNGPLVYSVASGALRIGSASAKAESREVDFAGAQLTIGDVRPGTDEARKLIDFPGQRQLHLDVTARDGTRIDFPLVEFERR